MQKFKPTLRWLGTVCHESRAGIWPRFLQITFAARYDARLGALGHQPVRNSLVLFPWDPRSLLLLGCQEHSREA